MQGMNRTDGTPLSGTEHIRQSVEDILSTPIGSRVMLPGYGSYLHLLVDHPEDSMTNIRIVMSTAVAIARWEPRIAVNSIEVLNVKPGKVAMTLRGTDTENQRAILLENIQLEYH